MFYMSYLLVCVKMCAAGIILCMRPANEGRRYNVTSSLIGWAHTQNDAMCYIFTVNPCNDIRSERPDTLLFPSDTPFDHNKFIENNINMINQSWLPQCQWNKRVQDLNKPATIKPHDKAYLNCTLHNFCVVILQNHHHDSSSKSI